MPTTQPGASVLLPVDQQLDGAALRVAPNPRSFGPLEVGERQDAGRLGAEGWTSHFTSALRENRMVNVGWEQTALETVIADRA
jgi:hypothetical protein